MKQALFVFAFLSFLQASQGQSSGHLDSSLWKNEYAVQLKAAADSGKPLLLVFSGSDWCKPCIRLREQVLIKPEFTEWASANVFCYCADFPSQKKNALPENIKMQNEALAEKFNPSGQFPLVVLIDANEKVLGTRGYEDISVQEYIAELEKILNNK